METVNFRIDGMTCDHCAATVRKALLAVPGVEEADVSFPKRSAVVKVGSTTNTDEMVKAVDESGYRATLLDDENLGEGSEEGGEGAVGKHLLIIGAGSGAFAAAIRGAELGARVTMVERGTIGGTCVNVGCVPSKTLIKASETAFHRTHHPFHGVPSTDGPVRFPAVIAQKAELVERLRQEKYWKVLEAYPAVDYVEGEARFVGARAVEVRLNGGKRLTIRPDAVIIATGASAWVPPIPGLGDVPYWTNVEALEADELPERLIVIGGSAIGAEMAQAFSRFGSTVTLIEALPTLIPNEDPDLGTALAGYFEEDGIAVHTNAMVKAVSHDEKAGYRVELEKDGTRSVVEGDRLLMATGRRANVASLHLDAADVRTNRQGAVIVDESLRTSQPHVFAVGDCAALPQFVYVAAKAGTLAAENALKDAHLRLDLSAMPAVTFTDPQAASVGLTEKKAREQGIEVESRVLPMEYVPRALANRDTRGLMKIVARQADQRIVGVQILSPSAGEVIQTGVLAVSLKLTVAELVDTLFPYLTEVEGLKLAAQTFTKKVEQLSCCAG